LEEGDIILYIIMPGEEGYNGTGEGIYHKNYNVE
jgi:hypothetical protein